MLKILTVALVLLASVAPAGAAPPLVGPCQNSGACAPSSVWAGTTNGVMSFDQYPGAVSDMVEYLMPASWTSGQSTVTIGSVLSATGTVTTVAGSNALLIVGTQPLTFGTHNRHPISIPLSGTVTWTGVVVAVQNAGGNQTVTLSTPAPSTVTAAAGTAIAVGLRLTTADVGKTTSFGQALSSGGFYTGTIATVVSANVLTVSTTIAFGGSATDPQFISIGSDNYAALTAAVAAARQTPAATLTVNGQYLVSKMPNTATRVRFAGGGTIKNTSGGNDSSPPTYSTIPVIPLTALPGNRANNQVPATVLAMLSAKKGGTVRVAFVGASTLTEDPGGAGGQSSPRALLLQRLAAQNPTTTFKVKYFLQGGGTLCAYLSACGYPAGVSDWVTSTATPWIGNASTPGYVYTFDGTPPDLVVMEISANDVAGTSQIAYLEANLAQMRLWPAPPAVLVVLDPNYDYASTNINMAWYSSWSRLLEAWGPLRNVGILDFYRQRLAMGNGTDPRSRTLKRAAMTTGALNSFGGYYPTGLSVTDYYLSFAYTGTPAALFTAGGNVFTAPTGGANDYTMEDLAGNAQWGYDSGDSYPGGTTGQFYMRGDLLRGEPGGALKGGTVPIVYGTFAMSVGSNSIAYTPYANGPAAPFTSAITGQIVTIPGAGSNSASTGVAATLRGHPVPPGGTVQGPLVGYALYINGTTIQVFSDIGRTAPLNALTAVPNTAPSFVMLGSPRVYTGISSTGLGSPTALNVWLNGPEMGMQVGGLDSLVFRAPIARPSLGVSLAFNWNGGAAVTWSASPLQGQQEVWIARPGDMDVVQPYFSDDFLFGCAFGSPNSCSGGGTGQNHPAAGARLVWRAVLDATDLHIP